MTTAPPPPPDGPLTYETLRALMASMDILMRPWKAFIGLVALHPTAYVERGQGYALDPSKTNALVTIGEPLPQSFILHPDDVEPIRQSIAGRERRAISDDELAAYLYWATHEHRKEQAHGR
jgi:hypothetical protein